jgi:hypothetical protein
VLEKLLRTLQFASFFLAGLARPGQTVWWVTDDDAIAPNPERIAEVTTLFATIASHYLDYDLQHFRFGTATTMDDGSRMIEDLLSIPDLVAGALVHGTLAMQRAGTFPRSRISTLMPPALSPKGTSIMRWFTDKAQPLKRVVYVIEPTTPGRVTIADLDFHTHQLIT